MRMTVAEYIADQLFKEGVRYVFGIPGGPSIPYIEAFREAGIEFVLVSNEATAGFMADVSSRLTGITGVCHATFGPGATNISTGVGNAFLDRSAVLVLTSEIPDSMINRTVQMNIDHQKLFAPITKATFRLSAVNAKMVIPEAIRISQNEYPGPVHIGLPSDIALSEISDMVMADKDTENTSRENDTDRIISIIRQSRKPLLAVGLTAIRTGSVAALLRFLETRKIPVVLTPMAKGIISESHPSYAGVLFHALSDYLEDLYDKTDLVIGLGYDPVEFNYESWMPDVPLIQFGTRITDLPEGENRYQYAGPPEEWFEILENFDPGFILSELSVAEGIRNEMASVFNGFSGHFGPVSAIKTVREMLPPDSILTSDVGSHLHLLGQLWELKGKGEFLMTNGWSAMGFGLPAALAAKLHRPDTTVACITGDGGFLMMAGEMITAKRYGLAVIIIVFSDGELNLIKLKKSWKDLSPYGTLLYQGDLFGSDTFMGVRVLRADSDETLKEALEKTLNMNEPVIINTVIDPEDYKWLIRRST